MSVRVTEDREKFGATRHRAVVKRMSSKRWSCRRIGGEGNGGVIDRASAGRVRSSAWDWCCLMADTGKALSEIVAELPHYDIVKDKYTVARELLAKLNAALEARWPDARPNRLDGLRLDSADRWLHVRASNTEPIVRVIAEAPKAADAAELCKAVGALLSQMS